MNDDPRRPGTSRRDLLRLSGAAAAALALGACSAPGSGSATAATATGAEKLTAVGLDYPFTQLPLYATLAKLAGAAARKHGLALATTNDATSPDTQASSLTAWVAQQMPAIVSFPMVFPALESIAESALAAGLIWVTYGGSLRHQSADIQFSFTEGGTLLGEAAARWANQTLGGEGTVAFLTDSTIQLGVERTAGMIDAFTRNAPNVKVVARQQAIDPDTGLSATNAILAKYPGLNLVLGVTDAAAYGAYQALLQAGRSKTDARTFVGGQDGEVPALQAIARGTIYRASAALAPDDIASAVVDVPLACAARKPNPSVNLPISLVQHGDVERINDLIAQNNA